MAGRGGGGGWGDPPAWSALSSSSPARITAAFETYFTATQQQNEGGIMVLLWRGGVNAEGRGVKRWRSTDIVGG